MKKNPILNLLTYAWRYSAGNRRQFVIFCVLSFIANLIMLLEPVVIGRAFNSAQTTSNDPEFLRFLIINLSLVVVVEIGFWIFHGTSRIIEGRNAFLVRRNYKLAMIQKVLRLPTDWHKKHHSGDTIDKINKGAEHLYDFSWTIFMIIENSMQLFGSMAMLLWFYWPAALVSFVVTIVAIFSILSFDKRLRKGYKKVFKAENYLSAGIYDYIGNIFTVITLRLRSHAEREINKRTLLGFSAYKRNNVLNEAKWFVVSVFISSMVAVILITNAVSSFRKDGIILVGTLFILYRYLSKMGRSFYAFAWKYSDVVIQDSALRATEVLVNDYEQLKNVAKPIHQLPSDWQNIKITGLSFAYHKPKPVDRKVKGSSKTALNLPINISKTCSVKEDKCDIQNISLCLEKGKKIALIGESGSGKSTVLSLLRGLYPPDSVRVYCAGQKLPGGLAHLYSAAALIPQDPELFNTTVEKNITLGGPVKKNRLAKVLRLAEFDQTVHRLPKGLKTNVMERGVSLSGGEKQRLALARGLYFSFDREILLLDEPTSSVDNEKETAIYKNIFQEHIQKTIVSSIHRLHLLPMFDYIYFFKDGRIIAEGTLMTLMEDQNFKLLWRKYGKKEKSTKPEKTVLVEE